MRKMAEIFKDYGGDSTGNGNMRIQRNTWNTPETYLGSMWWAKSKKIFTSGIAIEYLFIYTNFPVQIVMSHHDHQGNTSIGWESQVPNRAKFETVATLMQHVQSANTWKPRVFPSALTIIMPIMLSTSTSSQSLTPEESLVQFRQILFEQGILHDGDSIGTNDHTLA